MFAEQMRAAVEAAPRMKLPELSGALWKAYHAGLVKEDEAQALAELIQVRKVVPVAPPKPRRVGSRPRSSESMERRRRQASSGWLPPQLAAHFTMAENAVLAVVADEVSRRGRCMMTLGHIAALAGVCKATVRKAIREAQALGLLTSEEWRITAWRNAPNIVKIVSKEWSTWLRMRTRCADGSPRRPVAGAETRGGGSKSVNPTNTNHITCPRQSPPKELGEEKTRIRSDAGG